MARLRGRPLAAMSRAEFEALEQRVEDRALNRHLEQFEPPDDHEDGDDGRADW